ncbi:MAG: TrmB family transcriptional regulator [Candidatus Lokiarchaeota archaeon]|nr:TrmB family transcriptional regulator [Candidatus Lokiarchaeota archaeon]
MSLIEKLEENLKYMKLTQYEAKALTTLIRFNNLDASELAKYSNVPHPKIYETMDKLHIKGFIEIIIEGRVKYYKIRPKHIITQIFKDEFLDYKSKYEEIKNEINIIYSSEKDSDIPFIGIAGENNLQEYFIELFEQAKDRINAFLPDKYYTEPLISVINKVSKKKDINIIFQNKQTLEKFQSRLNNSKLYHLKDQIFIKIQKFFQNIPKFIPNIKDSYGFKIIDQIINKLDKKFGIVLDGNKKSIFIIPFPIDYPIAIISTLPDLVNFHAKGIEEVLKNSIRI